MRRAVAKENPVAARVACMALSPNGRELKRLDEQVLVL